MGTNQVVSMLYLLDTSHENRVSIKEIPILGRLPLKPTSTSISITIGVIQHINKGVASPSRKPLAHYVDLILRQQQSRSGKQKHEGIYGGWETLAAAEIDDVKHRSLAEQ